MIVQISNYGYDLGPNHFDIMIPGGGVGIFDGCVDQWKVDKPKWGKKYGGIGGQSQCNDLPPQLR